MSDGYEETPYKKASTKTRAKNECGEHYYAVNKIFYVHNEFVDRYGVKHTKRVSSWCDTPECIFCGHVQKSRGKAAYRKRGNYDVLCTIVNNYKYDNEKLAWRVTQQTFNGVTDENGKKE